MADLFVVGLDRATGLEVHVEDAPVPYWRRKGYSGDRSLVCLHCFSGVGGRSGTVVPLVAKGKLHGSRRAHFAHPASTAPLGGHQPESVWHAEAKQLLAQWARQQEGVTDTVVEYSTADRRRRSDVGVQFADGSRLALEAQYSPLPDAVWLDRHGDYAAAGIRDIWFWHDRLGPQRIMLEHGQVPWTLDAQAQELGIPLAMQHTPSDPWWQGRPETLAVHHPPCPTDDILFRRLPLSQHTLTAEGLHLPSALQTELDHARADAAEKIDTVRKSLAEIDHIETELFGSTRPARVVREPHLPRMIECR